jgi:diguanylate cyclase (GGDEF)-like protein
MLIPRLAGWIAGSLLITGVLMSSQSAHAACIDAPDTETRKLQHLVPADPNQALARADSALRAQAGSSTNASAMAWLQAVRAQAFTLLELDGDARAAAAAGLTLVSNPRDPVRFVLVSLDAQNVYDAAGIAQAMEQVQASAALLAPDVRVSVCSLITLGTLQFRHDQSDLAISTLMQAYGAAGGAGLREQRVLAAEALSSVMRDIGDYTQALQLNSEVIDWNQRLGADLALSVSLYLRGNILAEMRDYEPASRAFEESRQISVRLKDTLGVAFSDMRLCEIHTELGSFGQARTNCASALETFVSTQTKDMVLQTRSLIAALDLEAGRSRQALATLDEILAEGAAGLPPRLVYSVYRLRARANADLKQFAAAYADLNVYTAKYVAASDARRAREISGLRARFETDREVERNARLQRELEQSQQRQRVLRRLTWGAISAGMLVIGLLAIMLASTRRHRRQLTQLANVDGLTQLPNRRRTAELANKAIRHTAASGKPLTLALIDLDHFKIINDELGHAAGDEVLRRFAELSRHVVRTSDIIGRWGGEEFLLLMPHTTLDLALGVVERLRTRALDIALPAGRTSLKVSLSAGLACTDEKPRTLDELVAIADAALYRAKQEGRNRVNLGGRECDLDSPETAHTLAQA